MRRDYIKWYSPSLRRDMELLVFGERGFPFVVFPTSGGRFFEYEDRGMIEAVRPKIDSGELQMVCVDSVNAESWYNDAAHPSDRLRRHDEYDTYLVRELAPFVRDRTGWPRFGTTGCSFGGFHTINFALRHPDLVPYAVSMSGAFDMPKRFLEGYYDQTAYFHAPLEYLPNIAEGDLLDQIRRNQYVLIAGKDDPLFDENVRLARLMEEKRINHVFEVLEGSGHDWPFWYQLAQKYLH